MQRSVKVVSDMARAEECLALLDGLAKDTLLQFGHGWQQRAGVYVVYVTTSTNLPHLNFVCEVAAETLADVPSVDTFACIPCDSRKVCEIDPNLCGRWL